MLDKLLKTIPIALLIGAFTIECIVFAQQRPLNKDLSVENGRFTCKAKETGQSNCERTKQILDLALAKAQEAENAPLTVLTRLGRKEKSKTLVQRRKKFIQDYLLLTRSGAIEEKKLIFKQGQKTDKTGMAELYINNAIVGEIFYQKNVDNPCKSKDQIY